MAPPPAPTLLLRVVDPVGLDTVEKNPLMGAISLLVELVVGPETFHSQVSLPQHMAVRLPCLT